MQKLSKSKVITSVSKCFRISFYNEVSDEFFAVSTRLWRLGLRLQLKSEQSGSILCKTRCLLYNMTLKRLSSASVTTSCTEWKRQTNRSEERVGKGKEMKRRGMEGHRRWGTGGGQGNKRHVITLLQQELNNVTAPEYVTKMPNLYFGRSRKIIQFSIKTTSGFSFILPSEYSLNFGIRQIGLVSFDKLLINNEYSRPSQQDHC